MCLLSTPRRLAPGVIVFSLLTPHTAVGQPLNETLKVVSSDIQAEDYFAWSVAVSGTTAIIGAPFDDDGGPDAGAAYVFDTATGQQLFKLTASDATAGDKFGFAVAISGTTAVVGAPEDDHLGVASGSAYLFDLSTGQQLFKLVGVDTERDDRFGSSVAISGTTAIVGAPFEWIGVDYYAGAAYQFDTTTGQQTAKLNASDADYGDFFGYSVGIFEQTVIVGAYENQDDGGSSGSAYLFDTTTMQQTAKLTASDAAEGDRFGWSVAISGTTAIVGATRDDDEGSNSGSAYLFDTISAQQFAKLTASDGGEDDSFGTSVSISGTTAVVGARYDDDGGDRSGSAYLFDTRTGTQISKLAASDAAAGDEFGVSVTIRGGICIVSAPTDIPGGSAYMFHLSPSIAQLPQPAIVTVGETAAFDLVLNDDTGVTYQWRRDGVDLSDDTHITGSQSPTLDIVAGLSDVGLYDCVATNAQGSTTTPPVTLAVRPDPDACYPDANGDGVLNFFDVSQFIIEFGRGCP